MEPFTVTQWIVLALVFLFGLFLGMFAFASRKWKLRYREEHRRREELEAENARLHRELGEMQSLRRAADRHPVDRDRGPL